MGSPYRTRETVRIIGNPEEIHNAKAQEDEGDMDVGWDITSKDVERLRRFLTPTIHTLPNLEPVVQPYIPLRLLHDKDEIVIDMEKDYYIPLNDSVMQPLTPQTVHITPPDDDYVAPATNPMSNKQLNKFEEGFSHITETYFSFSTREATPNPKRIYKKTASPTIKTITKSPKETPSKKKIAPAKKDVSSKNPLRKQSTGVQIRDTPSVSVLMKKAPVTTDKSKGIELLSKAALLEDAQMKKALKKSKRDTNIHQASGSSEGADFESEVPDEPKGKSTDTSKGTSVKPGVLDVSKAYSSDSENESWGNSGDDEESDGVSDDDGNDDDNDNDDDDNDKFEKKAQDEKKRYIDLIKKSVKAIINDEVKTQLPQILPKVVSDFATPVITSTVNESIENIVLAKSSSQTQSTYEAATSLTEFELKKILLDKMQKSQSYQGAKEHKELYNVLVKSYKLDKDLFESYGKSYLIKSSREDKDKDEDPPAGSDKGFKRQKISKDVDSSKG
ncbi:hypothetical protein Tco_1133274 [Tanacetum coccineum]